MQPGTFVEFTASPARCTRVLLTMLMLAVPLGPAFAQDTSVGAMTISHPWARAVPAAVRTSAAYLTISNTGTADRLLSASAAVAKETQLHSMITEAGVMKMREVKAVDIAANGKTELKPGGYHIMLVGLTDGLKEGSKFPVKLKFEKAGEVTIQITAEKPGAHDHSHGEHKH